MKLRVWIIVISLLLLSQTSRLAFSDWPQDTGGMVFSSAMVADLDGNGSNEVIVGSNSYNVYVWHTDGTLAEGWPKTTLSDVYATPAIADLDKNGTKEIVVNSNDGNLYVWNYDGSDFPGFPVNIGSGDFDSGAMVEGSPVLADIDKDGFLDIIVPSEWEKRVYVFDRFGNTLSGWPQDTVGEIITTPSVADVDKDGFLEVFVGTYDGENRIYPLNGWNHDGTILEGWPQYLTYDIHSSPAIGDVDRDGNLEIVIADMGFIYLFESDGSLMPGWPKGDFTSWVEGSPALADINKDGFLEIFLSAGNAFGWHYDGTNLENWPISSNAYINTLGDIDNDGISENISISVYPETNIFAWNADGTPVPGSPLTLAEPPSNYPTISDLDKNGFIDIIYGSYDGYVYVRELNSPYRARNMSWPCFQHDLRHTGFYRNIIQIRPIKGIKKIKIP